MEKVRPWCGQPSDRGRLKNRTEQNRTVAQTKRHCCTPHLDVSAAAGAVERRAAELGLALDVRPAGDEQADEGELAALRRQVDGRPAVVVVRVHVTPGVDQRSRRLPTSFTNIARRLANSINRNSLLHTASISYVFFPFFHNL